MKSRIIIILIISLVISWIIFFIDESLEYKAPEVVETDQETNVTDDITKVSTDWVQKPVEENVEPIIVEDNTIEINIPIDDENIIGNLYVDIDLIEETATIRDSLLSKVITITNDRVITNTNKKVVLARPKLFRLGVGASGYGTFDNFIPVIPVGVLVNNDLFLHTGVMSVDGEFRFGLGFIYIF